MGLSENTFYRLSGICGIVAIVLDLPMLYILGFWPVDACIFVAGGLAIAAVFTEVRPPLPATAAQPHLDLSAHALLTVIFRPGIAQYTSDCPSPAKNKCAPWCPPAGALTRRRRAE